MTLIARDATYLGDPHTPIIGRTVWRYDNGDHHPYPLECGGCGQLIVTPDDQCHDADPDAVHLDPDCCPGCQLESDQALETERTTPR